MKDMKNKVLSLLVFLTVLISVPGCGLLSKLSKKDKQDNTELVAGQGMTMETHEYTTYQLDSLCNADNLPKNLEEGWISRSYTDFETNEYIIKYMYIKDLSGNYEMIYFVTQKGEIYVVSKRKVSN